MLFLPRLLSSASVPSIQSFLSQLAMNKAAFPPAISLLSASVQESSFAIHASGTFAGSSYHHLSCTECGNAVGVRYIATPPGLDLLRNSFAFDTKKCFVYQLGSLSISRRCVQADPLEREDARLTLDDLPLLMPLLSRNADGTEEFQTKEAVSNCAASLADKEELLARIEVLETEMLRMKGVMVKLSERACQTVTPGLASLPPSAAPFNPQGGDVITPPPCMAGPLSQGFAGQT